MKQFLVSILALLYLGTSAGATVHLHYCKGKLVDIQLGEKDTKSCSGCATKKQQTCMKSCCKDEHKMVKLEKDHQKSAETSLQLLQVFSHAAPSSFYEIPAVHISSVTEANPLSHAPPRTEKQPLTILHCIFRI